LVTTLRPNLGRKYWDSGPSLARAHRDCEGAARVPPRPQLPMLKCRPRRAAPWSAATPADPTSGNPSPERNRTRKRRSRTISAAATCGGRQWRGRSSSEGTCRDLRRMPIAGAFKAHVADDSDLRRGDGTRSRRRRACATAGQDHVEPAVRRPSRQPGDPPPPPINPPRRDE
jgi:hypothetical protein